MKLYCLWSEKQKCYMSLSFNSGIFLTSLDLESNNIGTLFVVSEKLSLFDLPEYRTDVFGTLEYKELNI